MDAIDGYMEPSASTSSSSSRTNEYPILTAADVKPDIGDIDDIDGDGDLLSSDDHYLDDNGSVLSSDYESTTTAAAMCLPSGAAGGADLRLRPPTNSNYHYKYPPATGPGSGLHSAYIPHSPATHHQHHHHHHQLAPPPLPSPLPGFYPNMWYPNAPYACSSSSSGGQSTTTGTSSSSSATTTSHLPSPVAYGRYHPTWAGQMHPHQPQHHQHQHQLNSHHQHPHLHHHHQQQQQQHHQQQQHPSETMMEMFQLSNSGREARNRAEKNRRDKLNGSIQELSTMVPHVAESPRRVDKTAVLRFAAHGLRLKYVFGSSLHDEKPQVTDTLMGMLDSFFLTLTCHGQIILISSSVEQHLGHCQTDLYGQSIMHITHPEDQNMFKQQLIPTELENLFDVHAETDANGEPKLRSKLEEDFIDRKLREDRRSFRVRLARAGPRSEPTAYEVVKIDGCFRRSDEAPRGFKANTFGSSLQLIRRTARGRDDAIPLHTISGNDIVLTACARIIRPPKVISRIIDPNRLEYKTRHLIDGRIIDCEQRIGLVAGYMTDEVRNLSPFTFIHNDDVRWVIVALRQMYDCNSSYGESTYRLFTRNGNIIYLQSKGYLEIDKDTNKVHSFVCVNTLLEDEEGKRRVQEMKKKFSVIINTQIPQSTIDVPASEHPAQLEKAVLCLIQNLQKSNSDDDTAGENYGDGDDDDDDANDGEDDDDYETDVKITEITESSPIQQHRQNIREHHHHHPRQRTTSGHLSHSGGGSGNVKTPPLALVPPETSSVKSSITKSVNVVNVTVAKHLRSVQQAAAMSPGVPSTTSLLDGCVCDPDTDPTIGGCDFCQKPLDSDELPTSTQSRKRSSNDPTDSGKTSAKRRFMPATEIEHVLSTSLVQIGRTLHQQLNEAKELRDQGNRYEVPHASQRIDEIMVEHQKQSELFVNIKSEYEVQMQNKVNTTNTKSDSDPHNSSSSNAGNHHLTPR